VEAPWTSTAPPPARSGGREEPPGAAPARHATPPLIFLPPWLAPPLLPCTPASFELSRRLSPAFRVAPASTDELRSSASPPSSSPSKESTRDGRNQRRRRRFPCSHRSSRRSSRRGSRQSLRLAAGIEQRGHKQRLGGQTIQNLR
jgi:hypothetical protein